MAKRARTGKAAGHVAAREGRQCRGGRGAAAPGGGAVPLLGAAGRPGAERRRRQPAGTPAGSGGEAGGEAEGEARGEAKQAKKWLHQCMVWPMDVQTWRWGVWVYALLYFAFCCASRMSMPTASTPAVSLVSCWPAARPR